MYEIKRKHIFSDVISKIVFFLPDTWNLTCTKRSSFVLLVWKSQQTKSLQIKLERFCKTQMTQMRFQCQTLPHLLKVNSELLSNCLVLWFDFLVTFVALKKSLMCLSVLFCRTRCNFFEYYFVLSKHRTKLKPPSSLSSCPYSWMFEPHCVERRLCWIWH